MVATQKAAKGYRVPKRTARLIFQDTAYEGAEVVVRLDVPVALFMEIQDLIAADKQFQVFQVFGESVLEEWNLEDDDGVRIPATGQGMLAIAIDLASVVLQQWVDAAIKPPDPLVGRSNGGSM